MSASVGCPPLRTRGGKEQLAISLAGRQGIDEQPEGFRARTLAKTPLQVADPAGAHTRAFGQGGIGGLRLGQKMPQDAAVGAVGHENHKKYHITA